MIARLSLWLLVSLWPVTTSAQIPTGPSFSDPRLQTIAWQPDGIVRLVANPGSSLTVILSASERITNVTLGDSDRFQVTVSGAADSLFIKPLAENVSTNMTVLTNSRSYYFELDARFDPMAAYVVRFTYPDLDRRGPARGDYVWPEGVWKLRGDRDLRPSEISDDGVRTFIEWSPIQFLPAVFAVGPTGEEEVVNGYMRNGRFVIDRIYEQLVFRIDRDKATATRYWKDDD